MQLPLPEQGWRSPVRLDRLTLGVMMSRVQSHSDNVLHGIFLALSLNLAYLGNPHPVRQITVT